MENTFVLEMKGISKSFPGVKALDHVDLQVRPGTVHMMMGENGAGKSTLMKILNGLYAKDEGKIIYKGQEVAFNNPQRALDAGIAMIHQELSVVPEMTIGENIFLGCEPRKGAFVDYKKLYQDAQELLDKLNVPYDPHEKEGNLTVSGMQQIEIAKAISRGASIVVMDEPTSSLTTKEVEVLFKQIAELKAQNVAIIYITHKMDEIFRIGDYVSVMRDGKMIDTKPISELDTDQIITMMIGRQLNNIYPKYEVPIGDVVLETKNLTGNKWFRNVNIKVHAGEIVGLSGLVGAGRSEVCRAIFGLDPIVSGEVYLNGKKLSVKSPRDGIDAGIAYVPEDRKGVGLVVDQSILTNVSLPHLNHFRKGMFLDKKREREKVMEMCKKMTVKTPDYGFAAASLSGGNQQKVVLAKWILEPIKVLILDEPTRGIDVGAKAEIHKLMCDLAKEGIAVIMISSELPEILGMSDRVYVMHEGDLTGEFTREEATQEKIMMAAIGGTKHE